MQFALVVMSYNIVMGIAKRIVCVNDSTPHMENGEKAEILMTWAQCLFKQIRFLNQKAKTAKVPISSGFVKEISFTFYQSIKPIVDTLDVPYSCLIYTQW